MAAARGSLSLGGGLLPASCGGGLGTANTVGTAFHTSRFLSGVVNWDGSKWSLHKRRSCNCLVDFLCMSSLLVFWTHRAHLQVRHSQLLHLAKRAFYLTIMKTGNKIVMKHLATPLPTPTLINWGTKYFYKTSPELDKSRSTFA